LSLKVQAVRGVKWTTLSSAVIAILHLTQLMLLARFLSPHDFGLSAILTVIISFSTVFVDFGLSSSIIYKKGITEEQLNTLYWLNVLISFIVYLIIFFMAPLISDFYSEAELYNLILIISSVLIIQAFGQQFRVLFQKELQFNIIAKIDMFASMTSVTSAVLFAVYNFGVYALIYPLIIMAIIKSVLLIYFGRKYHKVSFTFKLNDVKEFLSFGLYVVGNGIVSTIATQMDVILIEKLLGTEALGLYNVAKELILKPSQLINPIITKVAFPVMSKVNHDMTEVRRLYLKLVNYVSSVNFPIYVVTIILAPEIITLFLGAKWLEITSLFQILAIWAFFRSRENPIGVLVMAMGKPKYEMYWNISIMIYMPIIIYISSSWGIVGIGIGNLVSVILLFIPGWYFLAFKLCKVSLKDYFMSSFSPLIISLSIGIVVYIFLYFGFDYLIYRLFITLIIGFLLFYYMNKKYNVDFYLTLLKILKRDNG